MRWRETEELSLWWIFNHDFTGRRMKRGSRLEISPLPTILMRYSFRAYSISGLVTKKMLAEAEGEAQLQERRSKSCERRARL